MEKDTPVLTAGVIGAGWVATARHIPALKRDGRVRLAAIYDKDPRRAQAVADRFEIPVATSDMDRLFAAASDFVSICTPPTTHAPLTLQALDAGRHVLVEKPMAMSLAEAKSMVAAATKAGKRLCVCHNLLYARSVRKAMDHLRDAGPVQHVIATQLSSPRRRLPTWYGALPGGLFFDESPHILYLLRRILGDFKVDDVRARFEAGDDNAIDFLEARLSSANASASLTMAFNAPVSEWGLTIIATRKIVSINLFRDIVTVSESDGRHGPSEVLLGSMGVALQAAAGFVTSGALYATNRLLYGHERLISAFVDSILGGPSAVSLDDSLAVVKSTQDILAKVARRRPAKAVA
ncbi:MAG TPA: Gfo/Idh/MocA family oxidoreductase [Dehalococcoidia bacterium]|nr:Gfo/Idh/MocA family oxidoreductase [Dehalococcoidia bacterium]